MKMQVSLLDAMAIHAGCICLSDLRCVDKWQKKRLVQLLHSLSTDIASLYEWNEALYYLTGESAQKTAEDARTKLMLKLFEDANCVIIF